MFRITGRENGIVWNTKENKPLIRFVRGAAETDDEAAALTLRKMGYTAEAEKGGADRYAEMKSGELKAYALERGIDIGGLSRRAELIARIRDAEAACE